MTMVKLNEVFVAVAYTDKGQVIGKQHSDHYPSAAALEQFANGYQQADYIRVEKEFRYVRD